MIRHRDTVTRGRGGPQEQLPSSPAEIGRLLREARERRDLDLLGVHDRLPRPITQLEALESGDLASLPDQALALSTLRQYAEFLGLDGDALALQMIEAWSRAAPAPTRWNTSRSTLSPAAGPAGPGVNRAGTPEHLRAFTQTGEVPRIAGGRAMGHLLGGDAEQGQDGPSTGMLPVVSSHSMKDTRRTANRARRRRQAPRALQVSTWLTVLLLVVALAGLGVQHWRPQWLVRWHAIHISQPAVATRQVGTRSRTTVTPRTVSKSVAGSSTTGSPVRLVGTDNQTTASYAVDTPHFTLVVATLRRCWLQVSSPVSITPIAAGIQRGGHIQSFPANGALTVEVGSAAVIVAITINGRRVFRVTPTIAPFTYTFTGQSGGTQTAQTGTG